MKRINFVFLLIAIIGLSSLSLLIRNTNSSLQVDQDSGQGRPLTTNIEVASSSSPIDKPLREEMEPQDQGDSHLTLVSSSGSVKPLSVDTISAAVGSEQIVRVMGLKAKTSNVLVALFESEAGFPNSELSSKTSVVSATKDQVSLSLELPRNQPVAIAVFQDIDGNGKLTKNQIGMPTEPYGFSNNVRGVFGPPSFGQAAFTVSDAQEQAEPIEIKLR